VAANRVAEILVVLFIEMPFRISGLADSTNSGTVEHVVLHATAIKFETSREILHPKERLRMTDMRAVCPPNSRVRDAIRSQTLAIQLVFS
jgi:hypothetical protein